MVTLVKLSIRNNSPLSEMRTPIYNTSKLVTKKPVSGIYLFGHFLVRLSRNERSWVTSMGNFCWAHSTFGYEILTQKNYEV